MNSNLLIFCLRRIAINIPILILVSIIIFVVIQLPPGDYVTSYIQSLEKQGAKVNTEQIEALRHQYGLDLPMYQRYLKWMKDFLTGNLGRSFALGESVNKLIGDRLPLTVLITFTTLIISWLIAIPIALFSAVRKYTLWDYFFTLLGFIGMSIPGFFLAIILMFFAFKVFGISIGGVFSREYLLAPWCIGKLLDFLNHIWVPVVVLGVGGAASTIRILRATLLDELGQDYVRTARSKGISEIRVLLVHPLRVALNPLISTVGMQLPVILGGSIIVATVLSLPTIGPLLLNALLSQDMYLAGSILFIEAILVVVGTLLSDLLLAWLDPRIRYN